MSTYIDPEIMKAPAIAVIRPTVWGLREYRRERWCTAPISSPDPHTAKSVIETTLEALLKFDTDKTPLDEQAAEIQQLQQVAQQNQLMAERDVTRGEQTRVRNMLQ